MSETVFRMPSLGSDMEAGTLLEWVKQPGDRLAKGDVIAVVETQKGAIEVEVFKDAVMGRILVEPGATVPVGTPMAELEPSDGAPGAAELARHVPGPGGLEAEGGAEQAKPPAGAGSKVSDAQAASRPRQREAESAAAPIRQRASPAARRLAEASGIKLGGLTGSGPDGAILLADVGAASATPEQPPAAGEGMAARDKLDLTAMRKAIAAAMSRSKREIPHYYLGHEIDLTPASDWLIARNADLPPDQRLLMGVLFIKAVAVTLSTFPELNGFDRNGRFEPADAVHIGSAISIRGGGLIAPAIHDADRLDLPTLMARLRDLVARVRSGGLRGSELSDPTITVSSLGERGVDRLYGIIYPPQVAIVGFGTPRIRPWIADDRIVPRTIVTATLAADHRHSDGHRGALFLTKLGQCLQEPQTL